jgi:hypothetical protein
VWELLTMPGTERDIAFSQLAVKGLSRQKLGAYSGTMKKVWDNVSCLRLKWIVKSIAGHNKVIIDQSISNFKIIMKGLIRNSACTRM